MTTIGSLLNEKLAAGVTKVEAARRLKVGRQTLDHWLKGFSIPTLSDQKRRRLLAEFLGQSEAYILAVLMVQHDIDPGEFAELANYAKGV